MSRRKFVSTYSLLLVSSILCIVIAGFGFEQVLIYDPPYRHLSPAKLDAMIERPSVTEHILVVVVDGLRLDASANMDSLNRIRSIGASFTSVTGLPSLSLPAATTICCGALPEISGVTTNWYRREAPDSIFDRARATNLTTAVVAGGSWFMLFGRSIDLKEVVNGERESYDRDVFESSMMLLPSRSPNLVLIHFTNLDEVAHDHGGNSPEYRSAVVLIDSYISSIVNSLKLDEWTIVITSDHGHIDAGGHGGPEPEVTRTPLVIGGRGITHLQGGNVSQAAIAPTISVLLGVPPPLLSQYDPLIQVMSRQYVGLAIELNKAQKVEFYSAYIKDLGFSGSYIADLDARDGDFMNVALPLRERKMAGEVNLRSPALALALVPLAIFVFRKRRSGTFAILSAAGYLLFFFAIPPLPGRPFSISAFNSVPIAQAFFALSTLEAIAISSIITLGIQYAMTRRGGEMGFVVSMDPFLAIFALSLIPVSAYYVMNPVILTWALPDIEQGLRFYLLMVDMAVLGIASGPVSYAASSALRRIYGRRYREPKPNGKATPREFHPCSKRMETWV